MISSCVTRRKGRAGETRKMLLEIDYRLQGLAVWNGCALMLDTGVSYYCFLLIYPTHPTLSMLVL